MKISVQICSLTILIPVSGEYRAITGISLLRKIAMPSMAE